MPSHADEVRKGERFAFGENWAAFLSVLDEQRIAQAEASLREFLGTDSLDGLTFLDVGSGSGLFSLAARRLGATVHSFDFDAESVACTSELKRRWFDGSAAWTIEQASVLDTGYLDTLGVFDIVYAWGSLHHTGAMWQALANVAGRVAMGGTLFVAIYNDQGGASRRWRVIKETYNRLPSWLRPGFAFLVMAPRELRLLALSVLSGRPGLYFRNIRGYARTSLRGMSYWHDLKDWVGGYPFEVATPEAVFEFFFERGFVLERLRTRGGGIACNEFAFRRR